MAKLPDINVSRGRFGSPNYFEMKIACRVLKDGKFRGVFPDEHSTRVKQFYKLDVNELTSDTLAGLHKRIDEYVDWLAEATVETSLVLIYGAEFAGRFRASPNLLIDPKYTDVDTWNEGRMSFETKAAASFGARLRQLTTSTGRSGLHTSTLDVVGDNDERVGEYGERLLRYNVGPDVHRYTTNLLAAPTFVKYTEATAKMFCERIEEIYMGAIQQQRMVDALVPLNRDNGQGNE